MKIILHPAAESNFNEKALALLPLIQSRNKMVLYKVLIKSQIQKYFYCKKRLFGGY